MSREAELRASEQMRDRIAAFLLGEALKRRMDSGGGRVRRALIGVAREIAAMPGELFHPTDGDCGLAGFFKLIKEQDDRYFAELRERREGGP
ncbi:hypothetical protein KFK14_17545 [Sphingobium phenoxybenzoativorans]|uniref:Uncharacterized protein n=1 Tax=Sphingobium phenoxybenzoativorans TaxID=1592790 RepID=A0A975K4T9_9SPHN|nr:hypothetical protein [Sphingobium phenoxybenzoativorans]QUT04821.1 hypothetical protein KFK14_17545 [Sphingobium phenoxybenzoativorans]